MKNTKKTTTKKVKVVGTETYINQDTGQIQEMQVITIEERDFNFHKLWLGHILQSLDLIGNQKTKLAFWILDHLDSENKLCMTYRQIAENSGISYKTVTTTMQILLDTNFIVAINRGSYRVNPEMLFKGSKQQRLNVLIEYRKNKEDLLAKPKNHFDPPREDEYITNAQLEDPDYVMPF